MSERSGTGFFMKTVVLTFDDGLKCHHSIVAPELLKRNFGATFFVMERDNAPKNIRLMQTMKRTQVLALNRSGFEIGNHGLFHYPADKVPSGVFFNETLEMEGRMINTGLPKPVTFAFPGWRVNNDLCKQLKGCGYIAIRAGFNGIVPGRGGSGPVYKAGNSLHPLNCTGVFGVEYGYENFEEDLGRIGNGEAGIFCIHHIGKRRRYMPTIRKGVFRRCLDLLEEGGFNVVSLKDMIQEFGRRSID